MKDVLPEGIVERINQVLNDKNLARSQRDSLLEELAMDGMNALFPEGIARLPAETAMKRWDQLHNQLSTNPNRDKIIRVLESRASGERFHWLTDEK